MSLSFEERFIPISHINKGAFASVSRVLDTLKNQRHCAFKYISPTKYHPERALREANIHARFSSHPNVATLFDASVYRDSFAMAMELCEIDLLESIVPDVGLGEDKALEYMDQVMAALEYMHARGYVHRDIKPENLALAQDGTVRLLDFGHASRTCDVGPSNARIGTAQYLAPEGVEDMPHDATKMDVFSAGVCMFAIATGRFPWINASPSDPEYNAWIQGKVGLKNKSYWLSLSLRMKKLLKYMLEADPEKRWSAGQVRQYIHLTKDFNFTQYQKNLVTNYSYSQQACSPVATPDVELVQNSCNIANNVSSVKHFDLEHSNDVIRNQAQLYCCV